MSFSNTEQVIILRQMITNAQTSLHTSDLRRTPLQTALEAIQREENIVIAKQRINLMIAELEHVSGGHDIIAELKSTGLFRMLYRNPEHKGKLLRDDDILHVMLHNGFVGVGISAALIVFFASTVFLSSPAWLIAISTGLFTGAVAYLSGLTYGVINDLFATHANLPYFLLGHQPQQVSLLKTNDPIAQGIAWGVSATYGLTLLAACVFAVVIMITAAFVPITTCILPLMMLAMPLIAIGAEFHAQKQTRVIEPMVGTWDYPGTLGSNLYQTTINKSMCPTKQEKAAWYANSDRNMFGFTKVPLIAVVMLVGLVGLSAASGGFLPALLISSSLFSTLLPLGFAAVNALGLGLAGLYLYINKDTQVDNRYKLDFSHDVQDADNLYLAEDETTARALIRQYSSSQTANTGIKLFDTHVVAETPARHGEEEVSAYEL